MPAPYINATSLLRQPAGLSWRVVPTLTADGPEQAAQLEDVCRQSTSVIDGYLNQPLRATITTEHVRFPGHPRASMDRDTGIVTLVTRQWPVTEVNAVQVSPARAFPPEWTLVPQSDTRITTPVLQPMSGVPVESASGGNTIEVAPGRIGGCGGRGRGQWLISLTTTTAYPHAMLTGTAEAGSSTLDVDDVTGWAGWPGWMLDGPATEFIQGTAVAATSPPSLPGAGGTVQAGPGTVTLAVPLTYSHQRGTLVTALPSAAIQACALKCAVAALETLTAIAAQSANSQMLPGGLGALAFEAERNLDPFCRRM